MRVLQSIFAAEGVRDKYKEVRGPDGERFAHWRSHWRAKMAERYGLAIVDEKRDEAVFGGLGRDHIRRMRNARKRERMVSR